MLPGVLRESQEMLGTVGGGGGDLSPLGETVFEVSVVYSAAAEAQIDPETMKRAE